VEGTTVKSDWLILNDGSMAIDINQIAAIYLNRGDNYTVMFKDNEDQLELEPADGKQVMNAIARRANPETPLR